MTRSDRTKIQPVGWVTLLNGELVNEIPENIPVFSREKYLHKVSFYFLFVFKIIFAQKTLSGFRFVLNSSFLEYVHRRTKSDVWYINTIIQPHIIDYAKKHNIACIVHSHELEQMLVTLTLENIHQLVSYPKLIIANSETSAKVLKILGRENDMEVCFPSFESGKIFKDSTRVKEIRKVLGINESTFVWIMSGTTDPNKNPARFVEIANELLKKHYDCHFIWIGDNPNNGLGAFVKKYSTFLGIDKQITWTGFLSGNEYYSYLNLADGLLLTSMKESFSLVAIEALYLGKPVVSFNCGGIKEIMAEGLGHVVDSWNVSDITKALIQVMQNKSNYNPVLAKSHAEKFDIDNQIGKWHEVLSDYFLE